MVSMRQNNTTAVILSGYILVLVAFFSSLCLHGALVLACILLKAGGVKDSSVSTLVELDTQKRAEFESIIARLPLVMPESQVKADQEHKPQVMPQSGSHRTDRDSTTDSFQVDTEALELVYKALQHWKLQAVRVAKKKAPVISKIVPKAKTKKVTKIASKNSTPATSTIAAKKDAKVPSKNSSASRAITSSTVPSTASSKIPAKFATKAEPMPLVNAAYNSALGAYVPAVTAPLSSTPVPSQNSQINQLMDLLKTENIPESTHAPLALCFTDTTNATAASTLKSEKLSMQELAALKGYYKQLAGAIQTLTDAFNKQLELPAHLEKDTVPELEITISAEGSCTRVVVLKTSGLPIKDLAFKRVALSLQYPAVLRGRTFMVCFAP